MQGLKHTRIWSDCSRNTQHSRRGANPVHCREVMMTSASQCICGHDGSAQVGHSRQEAMGRGLTHLSSSNRIDSSEGNSSRRTALLGFQTSALLLLPLGTSVQPVKAAIVDEEVSSTVFTTAAPSVVSIQIIRRVSDGVESQDGVGSGVVWDNSNHILTNFHCISMADKSGQKVGYDYLWMILH